MSGDVDAETRARALGDLRAFIEIVRERGELEIVHGADPPIYAVRPYRWKDQFPRVNAVPRQYLSEVEEKWSGVLAFLRDQRA